MKMAVLLIFSVLCFGQINWEIELVDTNGLQSALIVDTAGLPHIVYNKMGSSELIYATKTYNNAWRKEVIDSGLVYGSPSLTADKDGRLHCSYYQGVGQTAYLTYAYRDSSGWVKSIVDSIFGILTNWWLRSYFCDEIEIDTLGHPGIVYVSWNPSDSLFYTKYIHYNGVDWDTSVVEYDTVWAGHLMPSDWSPNLEINSHNVPLIAFHQHYSGPGNDTIKLARWIDVSQKWVVEPVVCNPDGGADISMVLNENDYPYIAHGVDIGLCLTWWNGTTWQTEYTGADIGWVDISIDLMLDTLGKPHIVYYQPLIGMRYCYKDTIWHDCGIIDSSAMRGGPLRIDRMNHPHITYRGFSGQSILPKYARGTFVGIEEDDAGYRIDDTGLKIEVYPGLVQGVLNVGYVISNPGDVEIVIYDVCGRVVKSVRHISAMPGHYKEKILLDGLGSGIYFVVLRQNNRQVAKKFLRIE
ncbi:MAG: T9SS type A sorting domain-containing protein [bacterium]